MVPEIFTWYMLRLYNMDIGLIKYAILFYYKNIEE
jgi:hypothetical protein